jgi:hypothetical protein
MHDCITTYKFADDMALIGLITADDEAAYMEVVRDLAVL